MFKFVMTKNSNELFHRAIIHNDIKRVRLILEEAMKDPRFNIDDINDEGLTALQFSCFAGNLELVKILVAYGANWKIRDRDGFTILHAAAMAGYGAVVKYLLRTGLKPTLKTDDDTMPIDVTDEVSIIVILLRSMLDQGYLKEMQDYMLDHPKLKRNIFEELEKVKCREKEKNEILKDLPYTSHTSPRKYQPGRAEKLKRNEGKGRSRSTFSELSGSMQHLDTLVKDYDQNNNSDYPKEPIYAEVPTIIEDIERLPLRRHNSSSSTSSHESRASRSSAGSGGILRNDNSEDSNHHNMQKYLENRYPVHSKSVTFDLHNKNNNHRSYSDGYISDNTMMSEEGDNYNRRAYSDGYISDNYNENLRVNRRIGNVSRTSSMSSHSSSHSESCNSFEFQHGNNEPLYENVQTLKAKPNIPLATIVENHYENLPIKNTPPPIPPREPQNEQEVSDRQFGSETDSGIDIDETTGRVFALSLDDQRDATDTHQNQSQNVESAENQSYSKPIGLFYSNQSHNVSARQTTSDHNALTSQTTPDDNLPSGFFIRPNNNNMNSKYKSWNGRTLQDTQLAPYASHRRNRASRDDHDMYNDIQSNMGHHNTQQYQDSNFLRNSQYNSQIYYGEKDIRNYNFDHQPEIML